MILDDLKNAQKYHSLHPHFARAFQFLREVSVFSPPHREEIAGSDVYAIFSQNEGKGKAKAPLEAHRKYIDIQYIGEGEEVIGWRALQDCHTISQAYDRERDILFFQDQPETWFSFGSGRFALFFPDDAHAPLAGDGKNKKIVVKVRVEAS